MCSDRLNVALCADALYLQHAAVTITSLLVNNSQHEFDIYVLLTGDVPSSYLTKLEQTAARFNNVNLHTISLADQLTVEKLPPDILSGHYTQAVFARLFIDSSLPSAVTTVLYLDADIVVNGDIGELFEIDISNYLAAAVEDPWQPLRPELGFNKLHEYINSGVLLINLERWRSASITDKVFRYVQMHQTNIIHPDQCPINAITKGQILHLELTWNFQVGLVNSNPKSLGVDEDTFHKNLTHPRIIHYSSSDKPWAYKNNVSFKSKYWHYLRMTEWHGYVPKDKSLINQPKKILNILVLKILVLFRIKRHVW